MVLTGGCLCGGIRYEVLTHGGEVVDYCHCRQCRQASGAPVQTWMQIASARFQVTSGEARHFASSAHSARWFCPACGSQLYMTDIDGKSIGLTLGTLDDPNLVSPTVHGWDNARLDWFATRDNLPSYPEYPPYDL